MYHTIAVTIRGGSKTTRRGFTLIELVLASAVAAVILLEIALVFYCVSRQYRRHSDLVATRLELESQREFFSRDISMLAAGADADRPPVLAAADAGPGGNFGWLRLYCGASLESGSSARVVDYYVYPGEDENLLIRRSRKLTKLPTSGFSAMATGNNSDCQVLSASVEDFKLLFYDAGGATRSDWPKALSPHIPEAIEVIVTVKKTDGTLREISHFHRPLRSIEAATVNNAGDLP